jgi:hypothetical protein
LLRAQVAAEARAGGLLSAVEHGATVAQLRAEYAASLEELGLDADALPDPAEEEAGGYGGKAESQVRFCGC